MASDLLRALGILPDPFTSGGALDAPASFGMSSLLPRFDLTGFGPTQLLNPENSFSGTRGLPAWADFGTARSPFGSVGTDYVPGTRGLPQWQTPTPKADVAPVAPAPTPAPVAGVTTAPAPGTKQTVMQWKGLLEKYSAKYGVPVEILAALVDSESSGDPNARGSAFNYNGRVAQAQGLFQAVNAIWGADGRNLFDPDINADTIIGQLIAPAWKKYGTPEHVRAVVAGGEGAIGPGGTILNKRDVANPNWSIYGDQPKFLEKVAAYRQALSTTTRPPATGASGDALGAAAIAEAQKHVGKPYLLASQANNPAAGAFDCSGLVQWSYKTAGVALPRVAQAQYDATQRVNSAEARPGDLVFFHSTYNAGTPVTHVGLYLGKGRMLQAGSGGVGEVDMTTPYWISKLYGFGRVKS